MTAPLQPGQAPRSENSFDRILDALQSAGCKVKRRGRQAQASCPLHEDHDPSLSVTWKSDRGGITRLHCFSCGAGELAILEAIGLGLADRFDQPMPPAPARSGGRRRTTLPAGNRLGALPKRLTEDPPPVTRARPRRLGPKQMVRAYDYVDENGQLLFQNCRWEWDTEDGRAKTFEQRRPDPAGSGWITGPGTLADVPRVLRHLPAVQAAIADGKEVWLAEGEKDDESLNAVLGDRGIATTNNNGAGSLDKILEQLRGAHVVAVIDRDDAGYGRAHTVHTSLADVAASVRTVLPAVDAPKADATDHLQAGHGLDEFVEFSRDDVETVWAAHTLRQAADQAGSCIGRGQIADQEVRAQLVAALDAEQSAPKSADTHRRYAKRWAIEAVKHARRAADHAQQAYECHREVTTRLREHGQPPVALGNVDHELGRAEDAQLQCQRIATQAWEATEQAMPEEVGRELARLTPSAAAHLAPSPEPDDEEPDGPIAEVVPLHGGRGGGGDGERRTQIRWTEFFRDHNGHLGMRRYGRDGQEISPAPILNLDARVIRVECAEGSQIDLAELDLAEDQAVSADAADRGALRATEQNPVVAYLISYTHPDSGETMTLRVPADRARSCDWLADLPHMGLDYDSRLSGRSRVWDAIRKCSQGAEVVTVYSTTGWRHLADHGWTYIHAGGGITSAGQIALPVQLGGVLNRVDLPAPIEDPALLGDLFRHHSLALVDRLEPYVGAALLGATFRSVLGFTAPSLALFGVPGSLKSAVSGLTMQHFGTRWERGLPSASMSGKGSTLNALRYSMWEAKDCLFFGDDFAPDQGVDTAAKFLAEVARMHYNREERIRGHINKSGKFETTGSGERSRTSMLLTSEIRAATVSGQERVLVIDLAKGQLNLDVIIDLDRHESRFGRATVMASLLRWIAGHDVAALRADYLSYAAAVVERRRGDGMDNREAEALGHYEAGWKLIADFLSDIGAYTTQQAADLLHRASQALDETALRAKDLDAPTTLGERCRHLILSGLRTGTIHVSYVGGESPPLPEALRLGYRRLVIGTDQTGQEIARAEPRGEWVGIAYRSPELGPRLHVDPTAMTRAIINIARQAQEPISATKLVLQRELAAVGLLRTAQENTPQGPVTRYTVGVTGASGRQERLWDLDATKLFDDDFRAPTPQPHPPTTNGPGPADAQTAAATTEQDESMPDLTDQTNHAAGEPGPCVDCGQNCSLYIEGQRVHLICWKSRPNTTAAPAPATTAPTTDTAETTSPTAAPSRPHRPGTTPTAPSRQATERKWAYSAVVIDTTGVYLPDGTVGPAPTDFTLGSVAAVGEEYRIGHPGGAGLIVLTSTLIQHLGLVPDMDAMSAPDSEGKPAPDWLIADRIKKFLAEQTSVLSNNPDGWSIDGGDLGPWTRIRRDDRAFRLILEPYVWIWDQRADSGAPFMNLPDEADPQACWGELARRLERLAELLDIPWSSSPGVTGEALFDQIQRRRGRKGGRVLGAAGPIPDEVAEEQYELERETNWSRKPATAELSNAAAIHGYDRRGSYLSSAGGIDLGIGDPVRMDPAEAQLVVAKARQQRTKVAFGLWKVTLPPWDQATPPPHPEQTHTAAVQRWITTPTLMLLLDDEDLGGAGYTVEELSIDGAWTWPDQSRLLEPWYKRIREAFLQARTDQDVPVDRAVKSIYTAYIGRMASSFTAKGSRPWHHQPVWRAAIQSAARGSLWRAIKKHQMATGRIPVAIDHDEVLYLDRSDDPQHNPPAADNGRLGALKPSKTLLLSDEQKKRLGEGRRASDPILWRDE